MARRARRSSAQCFHERGQRGRFGGAQILSVRRHVAAALQDLTYELIARLARRDTVERGAALASLTVQTVAGAALFVLEHQRPLQLERRAALDVADRRGGGGPGPPLRRPRGRHPQARGPPGPGKEPEPPKERAREGAPRTFL